MAFSQTAFYVASSKLIYVVDGLYLLSDGNLLFYNEVFRPAYSMPTVVKNLKIDCDYYYYYYKKLSTYNLQLSVICNNFYGCSVIR
jgi:hypothetical protein